METKIIKGEKIQGRIFSEVRSELDEIKSEYSAVPGIAFVAFKGIPLGKYNLPLHAVTAEKLGFKVFTEILPEDISQEELFVLIDELNARPDIHAIILLQPMPGHLNPIIIMNRILPEKEVEGFHPQNLLKNMIPEFRSSDCPMCLPAALLEIFREEEVVINKTHEWLFVLDDEFFTNSLTSMIVKTAASVVVPKEAPLTFINRQSEHLAEYSHRADILVIVTKEPEYFSREWLKPGVTIIDIYSNLIKEVPSKNDPARLVPIIRGGINVKSAEGIAGAILPVPGGLMTVVMGILFRNALSAFKKANHISNKAVKVG
ncbi:MAG: hypothetical protein FJY07_03455 [Bacteroidetes bacterium]|nr:hypothetical protein [Bacteroidota bacterium]